MRRKLTWLVLFSAVIVVTALYHAGNVRATMSNGFSAETLATATLDKIDVFNFLKDQNNNIIWESMQKTTEPSDLFVQLNHWDPGGSTGWHKHPGHSLIIVTKGEVTNYESDDPQCKPQVYTKGMVFVDLGGDHAHIVRNEDMLEEAETIAVQLVPNKEKFNVDRRIDAPAVPANCLGIQ